MGLLGVFLSLTGRVKNVIRESYGRKSGLFVYSGPWACLDVCISLFGSEIKYVQLVQRLKSCLLDFQFLQAGLGGFGRSWVDVRGVLGFFLSAWASFQPHTGVF